MNTGKLATAARNNQGAANPGNTATAEPYVGDPSAVEYSARSMLAITFQRLKRSKSAMAGLFLVTLLLLVAALADVIAPMDPAEIIQDEAMQLPSAKHLMGTDQIGRAHPQASQREGLLQQVHAVEEGLEVPTCGESLARAWRG